MKINFKIGERTFEIESISRWQVVLNEIAINTNEKSKNLGEEQRIFLGYHRNEAAAIGKLVDIVPMTDESIKTFEELNQVRQEIEGKISELEEKLLSNKNLHNQNCDVEPSDD